MSAKTNNSENLKVFISYSRKEAANADELVDALLERGYDVTIDRRHLEFGQKWQAELADFIRSADTVIWLVSAASIRSEWVNWELDEVSRRSKRLVPLMLDDTPKDKLPRQLGEIHTLPAQGKFELVRDLDTLCRVLDTDFQWLKEASRLQDRATEWIAKERPLDLLLRGAALTSAEQWKDNRPAKAPPPAQDILHLLLASRRRSVRRQHIWTVVIAASAVFAFGLAGYAFLQTLESEHQRAKAVANHNEAMTQRTNVERHLSLAATESLLRVAREESTDVALVQLIWASSLFFDSQSVPLRILRGLQEANIEALKKRTLSFARGTQFELLGENKIRAGTSGELLTRQAPITNVFDVNKTPVYSISGTDIAPRLCSHNDDPCTVKEMGQMRLIGVPQRTSAGGVMYYKYTAPNEAVDISITDLLGKLINKPWFFDYIENTHWVDVDKSGNLFALAGGKDLYVFSKNKILFHSHNASKIIAGGFLSDSVIVAIEERGEKVILTAYDFMSDKSEVGPVDVDYQGKVELLNKGTCAGYVGGRWSRQSKLPDGSIVDFDARTLTEDLERKDILITTPTGQLHSLVIPSKFWCYQFSTDWRRLLVIMDDGITVYDFDKARQTLNLRGAEAVVIPAKDAASAFFIAGTYDILIANKDYKVERWRIEGTSNPLKEAVFHGSQQIAYAEPGRDGRVILISERLGGGNKRSFLYSPEEGKEMFDLGAVYKWPENTFNEDGDLVFVQEKLLKKLRIPTQEEIIATSISLLSPSCFPLRPRDFSSSPCWPRKEMNDASKSDQSGPDISTYFDALGQSRAKEMWQRIESHKAAPAILSK